MKNPQKYANILLRKAFFNMLFRLISLIDPSIDTILTYIFFLFFFQVTYICEKITDHSVSTMEYDSVNICQIINTGGQA